MTAQSPKQTKKRRQKSATESLLSIVLGLEAVLMFFIALALFRFDVLAPAVVFGSGVGGIVLLLAVGRVVRYRAGVWAGWAIQLALVATGALLPLLFFIGAGFAGLWIYCFIMGARLDRRNSELRMSGAFDSSATPPSPQTEEQE